MTNKCSVDGCDGVVLARGWCRKHYLRHYKYGDVNRVALPTDYVAKGEESVHFRHGMWDHPLYKTWKNMMSRCYSPNDRAFGDYGARGIGVAEEWHDIRNFVRDMGEKPLGHTIERLDNERGYSKENCAWASRTDQNRNTRKNKMTMESATEMRELRAQGAKRKELATRFGVSEATVKKVISGAYWSAEKIVPSIASALKR